MCQNEINFDKKESPFNKFIPFSCVETCIYRSPNSWLLIEIWKVCPLPEKVLQRCQVKLLVVLDGLSSITSQISSKWLSCKSNSEANLTNGFRAMIFVIWETKCNLHNFWITRNGGKCVCCGVTPPYKTVLLWWLLVHCYKFYKFLQSWWNNYWLT